MTYQIIITEETAANIIIDNNTTNVSITTNEYPITIEYNATQLTGAYGNANVAANLAAFANNPISTSGNITAGFFVGNGSLLTGIAASSYGNANVAANLAAFGSNPISTSGNITAGYFAGNGSLLTNITAGNITGTVANATYALNANAATYATNAVQAATANVANSVAGANVTGTVANATYALTSNAATYATQATFADTANAVAGANVSGTVANATYALNANASTFAGTVTTNAQPNITSVGILTAVNTSGNISATGNITGSYFLGNGSQLTGVTATDAIHATTLRFPVKNTSGGTLAQNTPVYATGSVGSTETLEVSASRADTAATMPCIGLLETALGVNAFGYAVAIGALSSTDTSTYTIGQTLYVAPTGGLTQSRPTNANAVQSVGAAGRINASTGQIEVNIWNQADLPNLGLGNVWIGNAAAYPTQTVLATYTGNIGAGNLSVSGNVDAGNLRTAGQVTATGNVSGGNLIIPSSGRIFGDFSSAPATGIRSVIQTTNTGTTATTFISGIPGVNHVGTGGALGAATGLFSSNDMGNASVFGMYSYANRARLYSLGFGTGNINDITFNFGSAATTAATVTQTGNISAVGNVSGSNLLTVGIVSATGNITAGNVSTAGEVTATGNINGANLVASANLTSTQQTVVGTANNGSTGNIVMSGKNIATDMAFLPDGGNAATAVNGRIMVGTGWNGNISHSAVQNRMLVQDAYVRTNTGTNSQLFASDPIVSLTGNVTNGSFRAQGVGSRVRIGGGSAANTVNLTYGTGTVGAVAALQPNIDVGNASPYFLGNTVISQAVLNGGFITVNPGSTVTNAYGMIPGLISGGSGANVNVTNYIGFASHFNGYGVGSVTGNVYGVYHGSDTTLSTTGISTPNVVRSAPGYYAFYNADTVAQVQLGSLRSYNEFEFATATSGTVNINKLNAQVQFLNPTANVTIGDFQNFVSVANDGTNNDLQTDTVTLIVQQGAIPYTVTMPTGNASIKYAGGISTIGATANAVTLVSITAMKSLGNALGSTLYLASVSSEFS